MVLGGVESCRWVDVDGVGIYRKEGGSLWSGMEHFNYLGGDLDIDYLLSHSLTHILSHPSPLPPSLSLSFSLSSCLLLSSFLFFSQHGTIPGQLCSSWTVYQQFKLEETLDKATKGWLLGIFVSMFDIGNDCYICNGATVEAVLVVVSRILHGLHVNRDLPDRTGSS